jgi:protein-S-isoprenylcysteine O-methyltransferase Ste14
VIALASHILIVNVESHFVQKIVERIKMKKLLPPSLMLLCLIIMLALNWLWPIAHLSILPVNLFGIIPLGLGLASSAMVERQFKAVGANVNTFNAPTRLVTEGLFKYSRNPMYLGLALVLVGVWIMLGSVSPLVGVVGFIVVTDQWYIAYEEHLLGEMFGQAYIDYQARTRRWL